MPVEIAAHGLSDIGKRRKQNEDSFVVDRDLGVFVVADGMGGHAGGEIASSRAVQVFRETIAAQRAVLEQLAHDPSTENRLAAQILVDKAVQAACKGVFDYAEKHPENRGMGTTFDALVVAGACGVIAHVGDSRVYLVRGGQVHHLTEDHTFLASQIRMGAMTKEQAAQSPFKSVLTRGLGMHQSVEVDTLLVEFLEGDQFLLCSDGLHGYLPDEEIPPLFAQGGLEALPKALVDLANSRGGKDNITAVVVCWSGAAASEELDAGAKMEALQQLPIFFHFTYKERAAILSVASTRVYQAGEAIVTEGSPGAELFIVVRGRVEVEAGGVRMAELGAGGHFGEMGLVESAARSATVRALERTRVLTLSQSDVMNLMRREQGIAVKLLWSLVQVLSQRLRVMNADLSEAKLELLDATKAANSLREWGS
jgi:PPM family protein phosphatase